MCIQTFDIWEVRVDKRLCLCVDGLDTNTKGGNICHHILAIILKLQVHLPTTLVTNIIIYLYIHRVGQ